jgi:hypothetical protein
VLTKTNRFALIYRVNAVKRAQTRERKIGEFVAMLARHETPYPQKAKPEHVAGHVRSRQEDSTPGRPDLGTEL